MKNNKYRVEKDSMGSMKVPVDALYGAQTQRAVENFPISNTRFFIDFINAIIIIKRSAAIVNCKLGLLDKKISDSIINASNQLLKESNTAHFPLDVFQTGSGTSTNMNVNEVISSLANNNSKDINVHPNDHVNMGQSSNDTIPTAINISVALMIIKQLVPNLNKLINSIQSKEKEFKDVLKLGRTHLQDATPIGLSQEFSGYRELLIKSKNRLIDVHNTLKRLPQGGTAVGTGINTHKDFGKLIAKEISDYTKIDFIESPNHFEAQSAQDCSVEVAGILKGLAVSLSKIANDIRWLASGPRSGLGELNIPSVQPGSSIMPGKVNPVICESILQVSAQVIANDLAVTLGALGSVLELNLMLPLIAHNLLYSVSILSNSIYIFNDKLMKGISANKIKCENYIEGSLAMCTSLAPIIGYDAAADIAYESFNTGKTIREVVEEKNIIDKKVLNRVLNPQNMINPQ
ncbi:MAG: aspartate ammonia-lyase [Candidatus Marinimicrobia bacterium]|nr:aspartate ammonia-lyase [Candidatus Neomarinimicrobiota bacterium]|tara:strand:- start:5516 stop:6898 length:1383 start_codon:yes stop_codon:yes gene_type:complete